MDGPDGPDSGHLLGSPSGQPGVQAEDGAVAMGSNMAYKFVESRKPLYKASTTLRVGTSIFPVALKFQRDLLLGTSLVLTPRVFIYESSRLLHG